MQTLAINNPSCTRTNLTKLKQKLCGKTEQENTNSFYTGSAKMIVPTSSVSSLLILITMTDTISESLKLSWSENWSYKTKQYAFEEFLAFHFRTWTPTRLILTLNLTSVFDSVWIQTPWTDKSTHFQLEVIALWNTLFPVLYVVFCSVLF